MEYLMLPLPKVANDPNGAIGDGPLAVWAQYEKSKALRNRYLIRTFI
jgi:hypothetical protein